MWNISFIKHNKDWTIESQYHIVTKVSDRNFDIKSQYFWQRINEVRIDWSKHMLKIIIVHVC